MDKSIRRQLKIALSMIVFLSYAALGTTPDFQSGLTLLWPLILIVCMPLGEWLDNRFKAFRTVTTVITVAMSAVLLTTIPNNGLLYTLTFLLIYIQSYSMVHVKREQTYNHILLMSFFMLLAATVLSPSANIGFIMILFVVAASWILLLLEVGIASQSARMIRVEDLVDTGRRGPRLVARLLDFRMAGWIMFFSLMLLSCTVIIFAAVPRTDAGLLGTMLDDTTFTTGMGEESDLSLIGKIVGDASPVMQVWFPDNEGGIYTEEMYWRVTTLDSYDGNIWSRRGLISRGSSRDIRFRRFYCARRAFDRGKGIERTQFAQGEIIRYEAFIDKLPESGVPSLQIVSMMRAVQGDFFAPLTWDSAGDFTVDMTMKGDKGVEIEAWAEVYTPSDEELQASSEDYMSVMVPSDYRLLTDYHLTPETLELVERLTKDLDTPYEKLEVLESFLMSSDFMYTMSIPDLPSENPLDAFILVTRAGHCELYASALAMMARSQGIPTRLVKGFRGGIWDSGDQAYTVVNNMAHVWVEVYYPDVGWVTYDPTPPDTEVDLFSLEGVTRSYSKWSMKARLFWLRSVIGYTPNEQYLILKESTFEIFQSFGIGDPSDEERMGVSFTGRFTTLIVWSSIVTLMIGIGFMGWRLLNRFSKVSGPTLNADQQRARKLMEKVQRKLSQLGVDCHGLTAEELEIMAAQKEISLSSDLGTMLDLYNSVRFGYAGLTAGEYRELRSQVRRMTVSTTSA